MLAQLLSKHGAPSAALSLRTPGLKHSSRLELPRASLICLSCFGSSGIPSQIGYISQRLRRLLPEARLILCCWTVQEYDPDLRALAEATNAIGVAARLHDGIALTLDAIAQAPEAGPHARQERPSPNRSAA
jgi:hypothetical protein